VDAVNGPDGGEASETAELRIMTFEAPSFVIELASTRHGLVGQIVPPDSGSAWLHTDAGSTAPVEIDHCGCFVIRVRPEEPFQLACRTHSGGSVRTGWIRP
jgi:hypothetical protein